LTFIEKKTKKSISERPWL